MRLDQAIDVLRRLAPEHLAESWDQVGLHVGAPDWRIRQAMLCIDLTPPVLAEAVARKADLVVAYHPPIFKPIDRLTTDHWKPAMLIDCVQRRIAVYSPHTALDAAEAGVNDWLAAGVCGGKVGRRDKVTVIEHRRQTAAQYKLVTFVPPTHVDRLRSALAAAGAGVIGDYTECSFGSPGTGTFKGGEGSDPFAGKAGRFETVDELRMEMLVGGGASGGGDLAKVVAVLRDVHPYEEPAFDIYPLHAPPGEDGATVGQGRQVTLGKPVSPATLIRRIKSHLGCRHVEIASPAGDAAPAKIGVVRLCAGAGGSVILPGSGGADALFTGEMRHHDVLEAVQQGRHVLLAGHTQTERPYLPVYRDRLAEQSGQGLQWIISAADAPPGRIV